MSLATYLSERQQASPNPTLLMTHVICGYPSFEENWQTLEVMQAFDVDVVELQFPFSEPSADGPTFVKANEIAISQGVSTADCFNLMRQVNAHFSFKTLMMGYFNTVFKYQPDRFIDSLSQAGGSGYIVPDLPIEEGQSLFQRAIEQQLDPIQLMTPTSSDERLQQIAQFARGFVYAVARRGVTGSATEMDQELIDFINRCRQAVDLPIAVGFGVSNNKDIEFIQQHADMAIIGTAIAKAWDQGKKSALEDFFANLLNR